MASYGGIVPWSTVARAEQNSGIVQNRTVASCLAVWLHRALQYGCIGLEAGRWHCSRIERSGIVPKQAGSIVLGAGQWHRSRIECGGIVPKQAGGINTQ